MKRMHIRLSFLLLLSSLFVGQISQAQEPSWVIDTNGKRWVGTSVRSASGGEIQLTTSRGQKSFVAGTYVRVHKPKPADLSKAEAMVRNGQAAAAIPLLESVEKNNRYLNWDFVAGFLLVDAYLEKKQPDVALEVVNRLQAVDTKKQNPYVTGAEIKVYIAQGERDKAERLIETYIEKGNRRVAAMAQLRRGDLNMDKDLYDAAILDYLRTTVFFKEVDAELLAESYYKAGVALRKKKDATRARLMFQRVIKDYPGTYWASEAAK